jgi:hypothetical protein
VLADARSRAGVRDDDVGVEEEDRLRGAQTANVDVAKARANAAPLIAVTAPKRTENVARSTTVRPARESSAC